MRLWSRSEWLRVLDARLEEPALCESDRRVLEAERARAEAAPLEAQFEGSEYLDGPIHRELSSEAPRDKAEVLEELMSTIGCALADGDLELAEELQSLERSLRGDPSRSVKVRFAAVRAWKPGDPAGA